MFEREKLKSTSWSNWRPFSRKSIFLLLLFVYSVGKLETFLTTFSICFRTSIPNNLRSDCQIIDQICLPASIHPPYHPCLSQELFHSRGKSHFHQKSLWLKIMPVVGVSIWLCCRVFNQTVLLSPIDWITVDGVVTACCIFLQWVICNMDISQGRPKVQVVWVTNTSLSFLQPICWYIQQFRSISIHMASLLTHPGRGRWTRYSIDALTVQVQVPSLCQSSSLGPFVHWGHLSKVGMFKNI